MQINYAYYIYYIGIYFLGRNAKAVPSRSSVQTGKKKVYIF